MTSDNKKFIPEQAHMLDSIRPSGIRKMFERAAGIEGVISLGIGAPDIHPPEGLLEAVKNRLKDNVHTYTLTSGIPELRQKIVDQYKAEYNLDYNIDGTVVGTGGTELLYGACFAYTNPGDEIIIPDPGFVYYPTVPIMAGCKIIPIPVDDDFQMVPELVSEAITEKTKMIITNSPGNPTGGVYTEKTIKGISELAMDNDIIILSDEVYEFIVFNGLKHYSFGQYAPEHTITLNSFSKTYCVPGWRLGFAIGTSEIMAPLAKINPFIIANPPSLSQYALSDFMGTQEDKNFKKFMCETMEARSKVISREFGKIPGIEIPEMKGSFYAFPKINDGYELSDNKGYDFVEEVFRETKVVTVPGSEFGESRNDHFRISFGSAKESDLIEAANRIITYFESK